MAEYASKGVAGSGLGLGIAGEFLDSRLIPNSPQHIKWLLGGSLFYYSFEIY